jgi:hypothetical protein
MILVDDASELFVFFPNVDITAAVRSVDSFLSSCDDSLYHFRRTSFSCSFFLFGWPAAQLMVVTVAVALLK